mmetsp:Transcript_14400/g.23580  ORF Transcript_14400/g.23580 Transcript_14400/m.23580 type:complete len:662 (-) Transcript_14400:45-2030(-)
MAKIIVFVSVIVSPQILVKCGETCTAARTCSAVLDRDDVPKSAALLQVSRKTVQDDASLASAVDEELRPKKPTTNSQLVDLLERVQSLEAAASQDKNDIAETYATFNGALDDSTVDAALLDRSRGRAGAYSGGSDEQAIEDSRKVASENDITQGLGEAFTKAVAERVAERKALADKAAFDAAVEKAVDAKLATEGIIPVPNVERIEEMPIERAPPHMVKGAGFESKHTIDDVAPKRLEKYDAEPSFDKVIVDRGILDSPRSRDGKEKLTNNRDRHQSKQARKAKVEKEEGAKGRRGVVTSDEDKLEGDVTKWIGDDLSDNYVNQHRKSHSGHSVKGHRGYDTAENRHEHSKKEQDRHRTDKDGDDSAHKGRSHGSDDNFEQEDAKGDEEDIGNLSWNHVARKIRLKSHEQGRDDEVGEEYDEDKSRQGGSKALPKGHYLRERIKIGNAKKQVRQETFADADGKEDSSRSWNAVSKKMTFKSGEKQRHDEVDVKVEGHVEEQHRSIAEKGKGKGKDAGRHVVVDPQEQYTENFPYEMLMDVDFIVDANPDSDSIENADKTQGRKSHGNKKSGQSMEKYKRKSADSSIFEAHSKRKSDMESSEEYLDEFRSKHDIEASDRDEEGHDIIFDQEKLHHRGQHEEAKKKRLSDDEELDEDLEDIEN